MSDTVTQLLQNTHGEEVGNGVVQLGGAQSSSMENGSIKK